MRGRIVKIGSTEIALSRMGTAVKVGRARM